MFLLTDSEIESLIRPYVTSHWCKQTNEAFHLETTMPITGNAERRHEEGSTLYI